MKVVTVFAAVMMTVPVAFAQHETFVANPDASEIKMTLKTNHETVQGTFHLQSGSIEFDPGAGKIGGTLVVSAGSGKTGNDMRDKRMDKEILKVEQFTTVSFAPKSYNGTLVATGDSSIQVTGTFTLLGTPHEITIPVQVHIDGGAATAKSHFVVPYVQWGVKNPSLLIWKAENDVAIDLMLKGQVAH